MVPFLLAYWAAMLRYLISRMPGRRSTQAGYSLIELVITVGMILVVTTWALPSFLNYLRSARVQAGARVVSAYLNEGRQLAIKTNGPVCVAHTTTTMQFRTTTCGGAVIFAAGLVGHLGQHPAAGEHQPEHDVRNQRDLRAARERHHGQRHIP